MVHNLIKKEIAGLDVLESPGDPEGATIILFHGFGANAHDLVPLSTSFVHSPQPTWLFPNGPIEITFHPGYTGRAWFPIKIELLEKMDLSKVEEAFPADLSEARLRIERLVGELHIPRSKLLLGGFSQGAVMAIETALHGVESSKALLIFSGTLICEESWRTLSTLHAKTPFFQSHGRQDPLLPFKSAEDLLALLKKGGLEGTLHAFNGGHEIPHYILTQSHSFITKVLNHESN